MGLLATLGLPPAAKGRDIDGQGTADRNRSSVLPDVTKGAVASRGSGDAQPRPKPEPAKPVTAKAGGRPGPAAAGKAIPGGQDSQDLADRARIEQLKRWQKEGKIKGDSSGLREQLRDKRNKPLQREARRKFDEINGQVQAGTVPDVTGAPTQPSDQGEDVRGRQRRENPNGSHEDAPRTQPVSSADKKPLGDLLRKHGLSHAEVRDVGKWLMEGHRQGHYGAERAPGSTKRTSDEHDHHYTPDQVEKMLQDYEAGTGRRVGTKGRSKPPSSTPSSTPSPSTQPADGSGSTLNKEAREARERHARVSRKLPVIEKASGIFKNAIALYFSNYVQLPLRLVGEFDQALQTIGNVESGLRGKGFVLDQQVALANALASATASQLKAWREGRYHAMIDQAIHVAREIDREDPEGMYGNDALSTFCADIEPDVEQHESGSARLLSNVRQVVAEVDQGEAITGRLLGDTAFMAAAALAHHEKLVFMAWQDFRKIQDMLRWIPSSLEHHHKEVEADLARVRANQVGGVITGVFLDESGQP